MNKSIPYNKQPKFWFDDLVNYQFSTNKKAIVTGMAHTSFMPYEQPSWHYHIQATDSYGWFQAWIEEDVLIHAHKNNPTDGSSYYIFPQS